MFANITLTNVPGLARLLREGETINDLMALSPEEILLRWFNYHLEQAGHHRRVHNFSDDIKVIYIDKHRTFLWHLLSTVLPENLMSADKSVVRGILAKLFDEIQNSEETLTFSRNVQ